ncbi:Cep3p PWA37_002013 [Arxiozyma heterogenica]|uniref:Zn(2)-C6 fungal-type domain-containing protein n=1 Tax=Arxiozyma heterogenica TaxID=278026 RepID=A0AAN7WNA5_9SACH|nr:hypothetical protein RI543_001481 [Kazachstania heterogenica]
MERTKLACHFCTVKKVKCDRLIPCGTCIRKGLERECIESSLEILSQSTIIRNKDDITNIMPIWQSYEYWIINIGLMKTRNMSSSSTIMSLEQELNVSEFWINYLQEKNSFDLLNFAIENLGTLFFSSVGDINDLFIQLEQYWRRKRHHEQENGKGSSTPEDYYWDALLWAIFTLSLYYASIDQLNEILDPKPIFNWLEIDIQDKWSETLQLTVYEGFLKCCLVLLKRTNYMMFPNVKLIQIFLILYNTTISLNLPSLTNNLVIQSIQLFKMFNLTTFKQYITDDTAMGLSKQVFSKMWYRLCFIDYFQSSPLKCIECHSEIPSLFQSASSYAALGMNIYQNNDTFELVCWKICSIDRDIEKTSDSTQRPLLKTIDAAKRELEKLNNSIKKLTKTKEKTTNSLFEEFILKFLETSVRWKMERLYLIYYQTSSSLDMFIFYTRSIIYQLVDNINRGFFLFNKFPYVLNIVSRIIGFLIFYNIFEPRPDMIQLADDMKELITVLPIIFGDSINRLGIIISRLESLGILWDKVQIIESKKGIIHPIFKIFQDDIRLISRFTYKKPLLIKSVTEIGERLLLSNKEFDSVFSNSEEDEADEFAVYEEFKTIIQAFQQEHNILEVIN